ncbi:hypothetical protein EJB05_26322, partial [Eragrostis curvula]
MSTAAEASGTRLLDLPDELLQRILYFVPSREAASTTVLSRRWRHLWPTPWRGGAGVHLDTRRSHEHSDGSTSTPARRNAFFRDAAAALDAHGPVRRLTIRVEEEHNYTIETFMSRRGGNDRAEEGRHDIGDVLDHPSCRGVEELHIEAYTSGSPFAGRKYHGPMSVPQSSDVVGPYKLSLGSCCGCAVSLRNLQDTVLASPLLDTLHLDYVFITTEDCRPSYSHLDWGCDGWGTDNDDIQEAYIAPPDWILSFCSPIVTILALLNCSYDQSFTIQLDAPRVRHFRYSGHVYSFPLRSPMPELTRVDLHIIPYGDCSRFWHFLLSFQYTKILKLKFECSIDDLAVPEKSRHDELLRDAFFSNLERLEVDANYRPENKEAAAVAIGNLLQCCPTVAELSLKLDTEEPYRRPPRNRNPSEHKRTSLNRKAQLDFRQSIDHFMRRKDAVVSFGGDNANYEVSDIPGLSDKWFSCVQFHLKRVNLQFCLRQSNDFGVQLAKFFFDKAMVLEELYIDDGNHKMCEHMNRKFGGRITNPLQPCPHYKVFGGISQEAGVKLLNSSKFREGLPCNSRYEVRRENQWSRGFTILPLER